MPKLLAPAGDYETFKIAIAAGADEIYIGMNNFSARAYAKNFNLDELQECLNYAHIRNVRVFVAFNILIFENELDTAYELIDQLVLLNIDGIIASDLALILYISKKYPQLEIHLSTQCGIDSISAIDFFSSLNIKRVVLARELPLADIKKIKEKTDVEIEIFVHGALCLSFSGNCLMSGLIGMRSGNRGRCVGSCRKYYELYDSANTILDQGYLLSMKDLKAIDHLDKLSFIDALKVEGRMRDIAYVANTILAYRKKLDNPNLNLNPINKNLLKTFHRTYTEGHLFGEDNSLLINPIRPNNFGQLIGHITQKKANTYEITLIEDLDQSDYIYFEGKENVSLSAKKLSDKNGNFINTAAHKAYLEIKEKLDVGSAVYRTKDSKFERELISSIENEFKRLSLSMYVKGNLNEKLILTLRHKEHFITVHSEQNLMEAKNTPLSDEDIKIQLNKLTDTPFYLDNIEIEIDNDLFLPKSSLNSLRREALKLMEEKILYREQPVIHNISYPKITFPQKKPELAVYATTFEQADIAKKMGIKIIYYKNVIPRNNSGILPDLKGLILLGGYNGIINYQHEELVSDASFNVCNAQNIRYLHEKGISRVTLSHELNHKQIKQLIKSYYDFNLGYPDLEMIVYGHIPLITTKYCLLNKINKCGECRSNTFYLKDEIEKFPLLTTANCHNIILNGKSLNLIDDLPLIENINVFRLHFTIEDEVETAKIISQYQNRLLHNPKEKYFDNQKNTRGHFHREVL